MVVAEVGATLVVGYIGCCLAIGTYWGATPYLVLRCHAFILRVDIAFVMHAWFIHGVTHTWWCPQFHGQGEHIVSPLPKVDLVLSLTVPLSPNSLYSSRGKLSIWCHVTVVFDPLRLLGSFTFFQVPVAWELSN